MNRLIVIVSVIALYSCKSTHVSIQAVGGDLYDPPVASQPIPMATEEVQSEMVEPEIFAEQGIPVAEPLSVRSEKLLQKAQMISGNPSFLEVAGQAKPVLNRLRSKENSPVRFTKQMKQRSDVTLGKIIGWIILGLVVVLAFLLLLYFFYLFVGPAFNIAFGPYLLFWVVMFLIIGIAVMLKK